MVLMAASASSSSSSSGAALSQEMTRDDRSKPPDRLVDYFVECTRRNERAVISRRLPPANHHDFALPESVPIFCLPEQMSSHPRCVYERRPVFFSFLLTGGDGKRAFGFTICFWRRGQGVSHWTPWALCFISHFPFFSLFKQLVSWMYREIVKADARGGNRETCSNAQLDQIVQQLTLLKPQLDMNINTQLEFRLFNKKFFCYQRAATDKLPHIDDFCFRVLFKCLSAKNVVYIVTCMLLEQRILIHSTHIGLLTPVCEALQALLFPFTWEHVYVPFLPAPLIDYLQAPMPYLMGLHTSSLAHPTACEVFASCVVVHLDKDQVVSPVCAQDDDSPIDFELPGFAEPLIQKLVARIASIAPSVVHSGKEATKATDTAPESDVELTFHIRPLGIVFQPGEQPSQGKRLLTHSTVVRGFPRVGPNEVHGPAEQSQQIAPGSALATINGVSIRNLTFNQTIDRIRTSALPITLGFHNEHCLCERGCRFAMTLKCIPMISALSVEFNNQLFSWVDTVRSAFVTLFAKLFQDYERFLSVEHISCTCSSDEDVDSFFLSNENANLRANAVDNRTKMRTRKVVSFDEEAFLLRVSRRGMGSLFFREFVGTQAFACFTSEALTPGSSAQVFNECIRRWLKAEEMQFITRFLRRRSSDVQNVVYSLPSATIREETTSKGFSGDEPTGVRSLLRRSSRHFEMLISGSSRGNSQVVMPTDLAESFGAGKNAP